MTPQERKVMELALEALLESKPFLNDLDSRIKHSTAITATKEALAQPEQEPVAVITGVYGGRFIFEPTNSAMVLPVNMALYAHPPQRKPLTDEQKKNIFWKFYGKHWAYTNQIKHVMEALEAAHGIKE